MDPFYSSTSCTPFRAGCLLLCTALPTLWWPQAWPSPHLVCSFLNVTFLNVMKLPALLLVFVHRWGSWIAALWDVCLLVHEMLSPTREVCRAFHSCDTKRGEQIQRSSIPSFVSGERSLSYSSLPPNPCPLNTGAAAVPPSLPGPSWQLTTEEVTCQATLGQHWQEQLFWLQDLS